MAGGMGQHRSDAHEAGFIFPAGIAWSSWLFYPCPGRVFQLPLAVRQPLQVYPGGSLAWLGARTCQHVLPPLALFFKFLDTGFGLGSSPM